MPISSLTGSLRRLRAAARLGVLWGAVWLLAGLALLLVIGPDAADVPFPLFWAFLGFLAGTGFGLLLARVERRRRFGDLSLGRVAGLGAAGGGALALAMSLLLGPSAFLVLGPVFAVAGGVCAAGTLAIARRAQDRLPAVERTALPDGE